MIKQYLKIALRNLWKNKTYSFINIFGLTLGLACFLVISLYVFDELTYDRFHKNTKDVYRIIETKTSPEGKESKVASIAYRIAQESPVAIPEVKKFARIASFGRTNVSDASGVSVFNERYNTANQDFLTVFDFPLIEGNRATALTAPFSVILTEETAKRFYGARSVVGRTLKVEGDSIPYTVTGVLKDFPSNSHLSFNLLFSEASQINPRYLNFISRDWTSNTFTTYVLLDNYADAGRAAQKLNQLVAANRTANNQGKSNFSLQSLKDIHFHSAGIEGSFSDLIGKNTNGNIYYIYVFSIVALFVLLIACINYMNLTTARFTNRSKEIAVRKVAGAARSNLVGQFLSEAFVMTLIALVLALATTALVLPSFNAFAQKTLSLNGTTDPRIWIGIGITILVVGLLAGAYPALFQSKQKPLALLKNKIQTGKGHLSLRRGLVVFQFALSIIMIVATIVVFMQMKYVNTTNMGFNKDQLVVVDINSGAVRRGAETIKNEYAKVAGVQSVSVTSRVPGEWKVMSKVKTRLQGSTTEKGDMYFLTIDDQFLKTFEVSLLKGRNLSNNNLADSSAIIINEAAAAVLGITEPSEQLIEVPAYDFGGDINTLRVPYVARVVGITKDFNFRSLREKVAPMIMGYQRNPIYPIDYFTVRFTAGKTDPMLKQLETILHKVDASHLFEYNFLDKQWEIFYREDQKRQAIFLAIAIMTILIACLGLFGLATYAAEQRIREIGIRKVLGASIPHLITMLSKDFLKLVIIAAIIAMPVAWWMMNSWLNDFAYRTKIYWWVFVIAGCVALVIALLTVGLKALKAAVANPVKSLRTE